MKLLIPVVCGLFLFVLTSCQKPRPPFQPFWVAGYSETWKLTVDLKVGVSGEAAKAWANQSMQLHLQVDSVARDSSAFLRLTLSDLTLGSVERDSAESSFMTRRLSPYTWHFKLTPAGKVESIQEEPNWPELGPAWVSPQSLLHWVFPTWERRASMVSSQATDPMQNSRHVLGPDSCEWDRGETAMPPGIDTLTFQFEWQFIPRFSGLPLSCPELPWTGVAHFRGERLGFGLKEFKWQAQAEFSTSLNTLGSGEIGTNSPLRLTREVLLRRL